MKKNLFMLAGTFIMASILLSSCSITKRRYTEGYYVSHNSSKQVEVKEQAQATQKKTKPSLHVVQNTNNPANLDYDSKHNAIPENNAVMASNKQSVNKPNVVQDKKYNSKYYPNYIRAAAPAKANSKLADAKKITAKPAAGDGDDVLSLIWVVILILVILWLIALLTGGWGLGGFIYLLLVIALILLILWLLRII